LLNSASSWDGPARDPNETPNFSPLAIDHLRKEYYERGRGTSLIHNPQSDARRRAHSQPTYRPDLTNIQHGSLTKELRDAAFDRLAERYRAKYKGKAVYEPTDNEILTEYYKVLHTRPHYMEATGAMSKNKLKDFRLYLRYQRSWLVSEARINRIVRSKLQLVTTGLIPVIDTTTAPRKENYHSLLEKIQSFKQETSNAVYVTLHPNFKSLVEIAHTINYENPDTPDVQPKEVAYVELTHRNARIPKLSDNGAEAWDLDVYKPSHKVLDVSDRTWESTLRKMFPQTSTQKNYFKYLYGSRSGNKLFLICFRHNELLCTSNVLTHRTQMPELCDDLRIVMENSPYIFMLIRGSGVDSQVESIVEAWKELTEYDPMSIIYKDLNDPQMCDSGIKPTSELSKFTASARYVFETFEEYERSVGLGTLLEQRASMGKHTYTGRVAVVPVPGTYNKTYKLWMSYHLQLSVDKNRESPKLVIGDSVFIDFHPGDELASINAWKGRITEAIDATSRGQLNVIVDCPRQKDTFLPLDAEEYSILTVEDLANMKHSSALRTWSRDNSKKSVAIFTKNGEEECKRLMNNITKLKVSHNLRDTYPAKAAALKAQIELLLMKNFKQLKSSGLFKDVDAGQWDQARQILVSYLRDHQLNTFTEMEDNGLYENTACVTGPSGSGKSYLASVIAVAYTLDINVPDSQIERNAREKAAMFESFEEHRFKKAAKSAAEAGGIEGEPEAKRASSKDNPAPPKPKEDNPETYTKQPGRVTFCGIQNDTVDEVYHVLRLVTSRFMISIKVPPKLVLRLHSSSSEIDAVVAMSRPSYNPLQKKLPLNYDPNTKVTGSLHRSLLDAYLTHCRGTADASIQDCRMKEVDGSAASYILELANLPGFPRSPEVLATFMDDELTHLENKLEPILHAHRELLTNGDRMNDDIKRTVKAAAETGYYALLEKAAIVCTTSSVATEMSFNVVRQTHAVFLEEAGRANDAEFAGYFSHYWNAHLRIFIGSINQLPPMVFGNSLENPFQKQLTLSPLMRLHVTGFNMYELKQTSRFKNKPLLDLCALVNELPGLQAVDGSFDNNLSTSYSDINKMIWRLDSNLIFVNVVGATTVKSVTGSSYSLETACAVMKDAVDRMAHIEGKDHVIITPYTAQVEVLRREREGAVAQALSRRQPVLAQRLADIDIVTVDSFMGKDRNSVSVDMTGALGHLWKLPRTVVATTRAKVSMQFFGPLDESVHMHPRNSIKSEHPLREMLIQLHKRGHIYRLTSIECKSFEQYEPVLEALGLITNRSEHRIFR
jgi:hypothetical protein